MSGRRLNRDAQSYYPPQAYDQQQQQRGRGQNQRAPFDYQQQPEYRQQERYPTQYPEDQGYNYDERDSRRDSHERQRRRNRSDRQEKGRRRRRREKHDEYDAYEPEYEEKKHKKKKKRKWVPEEYQDNKDFQKELKDWFNDSDMDTQSEGEQEEFLEYWKKKERRNRKKLQKQQQKFHRDQEVEAKYDGVWFKGTILEVGKKSAQVLFDGETEDESVRVKFKNIRLPEKKKSRRAKPIIEEEPAPVVKKKRSHDWEKGDDCEAYYAEDSAWLPAKITGIEEDHVFIQFVGYEEDPPYKMDLGQVRRTNQAAQEEVSPEVQIPEVEVQKGWQVGDWVSCTYEDEGEFDGEIQEIKDGEAHIILEGYEEYDAHVVPLDKVMEPSKPRPERKKAEAAKPARPDRKPTPKQKYAHRDGVYVYDKGAPHTKDDFKRWEGKFCFVRGYDPHSGTYDVQDKRTKDFIRDVTDDQIERKTTNQEMAEGVFATLQKTKIHKDEWTDVHKTLWGKSGKWESFLTNRDGDVSYHKAEEFEEDPDYLWWKDEVDGRPNPLPELEWFVPELPDILCGDFVTIDQGTGDEKTRCRVKTFDHKTGIYGVEIRDGDDKEILDFAADRLTKEMSKADKAMKLFAALQKRKMSKRLFERAWEACFGSSDRPPRMEWLNGEVLDSDEDNIWLNEHIELPPKTGEVLELPKFIERDTVTVPPSAIGREGRRELRGFVRECDRQNKKYKLNFRIRARDDEEDAEDEEFDEWVHESCMKVSYRLNEKFAIIFGSFRSSRINQKDFKLAMHLFFDDRPRNLKKTVENVDSCSFERGTVIWDDMDDFPDAPDDEDFQTPPRVWKQGDKVEAWIGFNWVKASIDSVVDEFEGKYMVELRDSKEEMSALKLKKSIPLTRKLTGCFSQSQTDRMTFEEINAGIREMFGGTNEFSDENWSMIKDRMFEPLENAGITIDCVLREISIAQIPQPNIQAVWDRAEGMGFLQKIESVFKHCNENTLTLERFNEEMKNLFDDEVRDFSNMAQRADKISFDDTNNTVSYQGDLSLIRDLGVEQDEVDWAEKFKLVGDIDWEAEEMADRIDFTKDFSELIDHVKSKTEDEIKQFTEQHQISFEGNNPAKPVFTFADMFDMFKKHPNHEVVRAAEAIHKQLKDDFQFEGPTPIQCITWTTALKNRDILGISKTGSGKTIAFAVPVLLKCALQNALLGGQCYRGRFFHALVLAPNRELATQHAFVFSRLGKNAGLKALAVIGGQRKRDQKEVIQDGVDVICATTGRLNDFMLEGTLDLRNTTMIVLDEADTLLMDFDQEVREVLLDRIRPGGERQCFLFSATYSQEVSDLKHGFFKEDAIRIEIGGAVRADPNVQQKFILLESFREKEIALIALIRYLLNKSRNQQILIFCNAKVRVDEIHELLHREEDLRRSVERLHSDLSQEERQGNLSCFKNGEKNILVVTDVASRGWDIKNVVVIQYEFPRGNAESSIDMLKETYIHRLGRAGRANAKGFNYTIATDGPEWQEGLMEVLSGANQFGPPLLYEKCDEEIPDEAQEIPNWPMYAGGPSVFEQYFEPMKEDGWFTRDTSEAAGNGMIASLDAYYQKEDWGKTTVRDALGADAHLCDNVNPTQEDCAVIAEKLGIQIKATTFVANEDGDGVEQADYFVVGEADFAVEVMWIPASQSGDRDRYQPIGDEEIAAKGKAKPKRKVEEPYIPPAKVENWAGQRVLAYLEQFGESYAGQCTDDDGTTATVILDDYPGEQYEVPSSACQHESDKVLAKVEVSNKIGMKVEVEFDGKYYPAEILDDFGGDIYHIKYDDESFGEEPECEGSRIKFPEAPAEPAAEATDAQVEFGGEYYNASVVANGDGTYYVTYEDTSFGVEEAVEEGRIKFPGAEEAAAGVQVQVEYEGENFPATAQDNGDGTYFVTYEDTSYGTEEAVPESRITFPESAKVASEAVEVEFDGEYFPATAQANGDGTYYVTYENTEFGVEEAVPKDRIRFSSAAAPAAAPAAASAEPVKAMVEFDGEQYPADVVDNGDGTYTVTYEDEEYGVEEAVPKARVTIGAAAAAAEFGEGAAVSAYFAEEDTYYPAKVSTVNADGSYNVVYDGFEDIVHLAADHVKALEADAPVEEVPASLPQPPAISVPEDPLVNSEVEVLFDGEFYPALCAAKNSETLTYTVVYHDEEYGAEEVERERIRIPEAQEEEVQPREDPPAAKADVHKADPARAAFRTGMEVLAKYSDDGEFYKARILENCHDGTYEVLYTEYEETAVIPETDIKLASSSKSAIVNPPVSTFVVGQTVEAKYAEDGEFYVAEIIQDVQDGSFEVQYTEYGSTGIVLGEDIRLSTVVAEDAEDDISAPQNDQHIVWLKNEVGVTGYAVGQKVMAAYDDEYFAATVVGINEDSTYKITYDEFPDDGEVDVPESDLKMKGAGDAEAALERWAAGDRVSIYFEDEDSYLSGGVAAVNEDGTYKVYYDGFEDDLVDVTADYIQALQVEEE